MRICMVGHFDNYDEGVRNVARNLCNELSKDPRVEIIKINLGSLLFNKEIKKFRPEVIHFILSPTLYGILLAKFISFLYPSSKVIISAIHPHVPKFKLLKYFNPDLILVQSEISANLFEYLNFNVDFLSNGVDTNKFKPFSAEKNMLKKKYGIPLDKFIILHLASFKRQRNLDIFKKLQNKDDNLVLLIGRADEKYDEILVSELKASGCLILIEHFSQIEEIINIADCYVFPTNNPKACIETPLSVLEALSCNIPVITTKFGSLPFLFDDGNGIYFVDTEDDIFKKIEYIKNNDISPDNSKMIISFSWQIVANNLLKIYQNLLTRR